VLAVISNERKPRHARRKLREATKEEVSRLKDRVQEAKKRRTEAEKREEDFSISTKAKLEKACAFYASQKELLTFQVRDCAPQRKRSL
jgi:hypothetical protein